MIYCIFRIAVVCLLLVAVSANANAGLIGIDAFGSHPRVVDYNGLGFAANFSGPLLISGDRYTTDDNYFRYNSSFGTFLRTTGEGIGNDTDLGFIDIELAEPVLRAGAIFGQGFGPWSVTVDFFDQFNQKIGTANVGNATYGGQFAGWEADFGLISRIRATDISNGSVLIMDDFISEVAAVPEPSSIVLFLLASVIGIFRFRP